MSTEKNTIDDRVQNVELFISKALRLGVIISAAIIILGLIMFIATGKSGYPGSSFPTSLLEIFNGLIMLKPYAVIMTGLLLLILTPIFRVGVSIIAFFKQKDYLYIIITAIVLVILVVSFVFGKGGE